MKKLFTLAMMMTIAISARSAMPLGSSKNTMSYSEVKNEALFLSDKMAYELNLTNDQYDAVYEINLDYLMSVNGRNGLYGSWWDRRNKDLQFVLTVYQYNKYLGLSYFYRPLSWNDGHVTLNIYSHYTNRNHFYKGRPSVFVNYRGGNNKKANHYADRKPTQHNNGGGSTWRNTGNNHGGGSTGRNDNRSNSHFGSGRQVAQNNHGSFGGRR